MRLVYAFALLAFLSTPVRAAVGVVRSGAGADPAQAARVQAAQQAVEGALDRLGVSYRGVDEDRLTDAALRPFETLVLPFNELDQREAAVLKRFADRGGRLVAYAPAGPPEFAELLGLKPGPMPGLFEPRALVPNPRPGMPERIPAPKDGVYRSFVAADAGHEAGRWLASTGPSALVRGPFGYFANLVPAAGTEHAFFLLAMLGDLDPRVWAEADSGSRTRAVEAVRDAGRRWADPRRQAEFSSADRDRIETELRAQRARIPSAQTPIPEVESNRPLLAERVLSAQRVAEDAERLCYRMTPTRKGEVRGMWIFRTQRTDWDELMRKCRDAGLNAVFVRVSRGGSAIYPSDVLPREPWAENGPDELRAAIDAAKRYGLAFHAWRVNFHMGSAPQAFYDRMAAEDRLVRDPKGQQGRFLNPADPRNQEQELQAMLELVRKYDIDGLHLDYIRYPDEPHYDWDYGPVSRREFERASGKAVEAWPETVLSGSRKLEYEEWERGNVNRLVQRVSGEVKRAKPAVQLSAAVWRNHRRYRAIIKQDWPLWAREGWVDFLVPMDYTPEADLLSTAVREQISAVGARVPVLAGLGAYLVPRPMDVVLQVESAREQGADGFVLFSANNPDLDAQLAALRAGATAEGTWLGYIAPRAEWALPEGLVRKDAPVAFGVGERVNLEGQVRNVASTGAAIRTLRAEVRLEDPYGRLIATAGALSGFARGKLRFEVPAGFFRPVLRGSMSLADGNVRPFVLRGPLCEGVSPEELAELRAREQPPVVRGDGKRLAVWAGGMGADALLRNFREELNVTPFPLYQLRPDHLRAAKILVLPQARDVDELSPVAILALREWVSSGGTLLLTHDAVGARWHPRIFPEVGRGGEASQGRALTISQAFGDLKVGETLEHSFDDHIRLIPGEGAQVLAREPGPDGAPVVVAGNLGQGRVILYGAAPGDGGREMTAGERGLLRALLGLAPSAGG